MQDQKYFHLATPDAKITELDLKIRKIKLSVKATQIDEEKSYSRIWWRCYKVIFPLKGIFEKAIGKKKKRKVIVKTKTD